MRSYSFILLVIILVSSGNATPWGIPGEAVIRSENGKLLICTPVQASPSVSVRALSVSERALHHNGRLLMWQVVLTPENPPLSLKSGDCISYGALPAGYRQSAPEKPLKVGETYYARIDALIAHPLRQSVLFYDAIFCVKEDHGRKVEYLQHQYEQSGAVIKPSC
ncbi:hypothetical protein ACLEJQ_05515 [Pseudomonas sp. SMV71]|uniref:hypothetical protein n=1 Tax=unclassified Pseudomonas TaxID=196821 RepID=UPI003F877BA0